jgi:hypothetical protein
MGRNKHPAAAEWVISPVGNVVEDFVGHDGREVFFSNSRLQHKRSDEEKLLLLLHKQQTFNVTSCIQALR